MIAALDKIFVFLIPWACFNFEIWSGVTSRRVAIVGLIILVSLNFLRKTYFSFLTIIIFIPFFLLLDVYLRFGYFGQLSLFYSSIIGAALLTFLFFAYVNRKNLIAFNWSTVVISCAMLCIFASWPVFYALISGLSGGDLRDYFKTAFSINSYGNYMVGMSLLLTYSFLNADMAPIIRKLAFVTILVSGAAVFLTLSRQNVGVLLVCTLFLMGRRVFQPFCLVSAGVIGFAVYLSGYLWVLNAMTNRVAGAISGADGSLTSRILQFEKTIEIFVESPFGIGPGRFSFLAMDLSHNVTESFYLEVLVAYGIIGAVIIALFWMAGIFAFITPSRKITRLWVLYFSIVFVFNEAGYDAFFWLSLVMLLYSKNYVLSGNDDGISKNRLTVRV